MGSTEVILYFLGMAATIVLADVLFFKNRAGARLTANVLIVAVFAAVYVLVTHRA